MSSVQGYKRCPKCGGVIFYEFNCRTMEESRYCMRCGFKQRWFLQRNEDGSVVKNSEGKMIMDYSEMVGYGTAYLDYKKGFGARYSLEQPLSDEAKKEFLEAIKGDDVKEDTSYVIAFDPETRILTAEYGSIPPGYDESDYCEE